MMVFNVTERVLPCHGQRTSIVTFFLSGQLPTAAPVQQGNGAPESVQELFPPVIVVTVCCLS